MKALISMLVAWLLYPGAALAADQAHALAQSAGSMAFHYGVVPAQVVLAHADRHPEREMHGGSTPKTGSHIVLALFDIPSGERIASGEVTATVTLLGGPSVTRRLEPMTIAGQPSFGGFFALGAPGIYRLRFEARRPDAAQPEVAEFEHRVSPEGRR